MERFMWVSRRHGRGGFVVALDDPASEGGAGRSGSLFGWCGCLTLSFASTHSEHDIEAHALTLREEFYQLMGAESNADAAFRITSTPLSPHPGDNAPNTDAAQPSAPLESPDAAVVVTATSASHNRPPRGPKRNLHLRVVPPPAYSATQQPFGPHRPSSAHLYLRPSSGGSSASPVYNPFPALAFGPHRPSSAHLYLAAGQRAFPFPAASAPPPPPPPPPPYFDNR